MDSPSRSRRDAGKNRGKTGGRPVPAIFPLFFLNKTCILSASYHNGRRSRVLLPGVACHVTQRGVDRRETFSSGHDPATIAIPTWISCAGISRTPRFEATGVSLKCVSFLGAEEMETTGTVPLFPPAGVALSTAFPLARSSDVQSVPPSRRQSVRRRRAVPQRCRRASANSRRLRVICRRSAADDSERRASPYVRNAATSPYQAGRCHHHR